MEKNFWVSRWKEGKTGFHQLQFNDKLLKYFPTFASSPGDKVLVPLCGKTKDMIWLCSQGLSVHGIEFYETAVREFFEENSMRFEEIDKGDFLHFQGDQITLSVGDFFNLRLESTYDFIYDRASLVALPIEMRKKYAKVIERALKPNGKYLLLTYEYNLEELEGPPFSVLENEVYELYQDNFDIKLLEVSDETFKGPRLAGVSSLLQKVYQITKI